MPTSFRQIINKAVKDKRFLVVPGAHDALSARLIEKIGFETYFIGGFPAVGARYGVPDVGLKGFGEIAAAVRDIMGACDLPAFVDGDDGYGDVKNVVHTVQTYERMGVSAILIEDQQWPKRCGHMVGKKVVPIELAEAKIRAACAERINPETWILGRTDARAVYDLDEAMRRAERYIRAGADGIFIEAPRSIAELERIGKAFDVPQICNPLMGGHTPILSMDELGQLGFNCAVLGLDTIMHAAKAIEAVLVDMKSGKFAHRNDGMDFEQYKKLVGYDKWESIDERFAPRRVIGNSGLAYVLLNIVFAVDWVLAIYAWLALAAMVLVWLRGFNVVTDKTHGVAFVGKYLGLVIEPFLRPLRPILPKTGVVDGAPFLLLLIIMALRYAMALYLIPKLA